VVPAAYNRLTNNLLQSEHAEHLTCVGWENTLLRFLFLR
jgi:hypothetical protein